jgi:hypothetical protein
MVTTAVQDVEMKDADSPAEVDPAEQKKDADLAAIEGEKKFITISPPKFRRFRVKLTESQNIS